MHRSYQSILPCHNKLLKQKWDKTYYDEHRKKVRDAGPMVDTAAPVTYMHLHLKLKKLQLEEERLATIERDNRILLEKMSCIMRTKGRVDNLNNYDPKSLNREKRQRELLRVTRENQAILKRIMMRKAEYNQDKWQRDWVENQQFMDSISHYPPEWWLIREEAKTSSRKEKKDSKDRGNGEGMASARRSGRKSRKHKERNNESECETAPETDRSGIKEEVKGENKDEDVKGKGHEDVRGKGHEDAKGKGREDAKGKGREDAKGKGRDDAKGKGREDAKGNSREDAKGNGREDAKGNGHEDAKGNGHEDAKDKGHEDVKDKSHKSEGHGDETTDEEKTAKVDQVNKSDAREGVASSTKEPEDAKKGDLKKENEENSKSADVEEVIEEL